MSNKVSIGFTGDFSFSGHFVGCHTKEDLIASDILAFLNKNDANVINFESPVTPCRVSNKKRLVHRCPVEVLDYVQDKFKNPVLSLANNHMMDYGRIGMIDTLEAMEQYNMPFIGAGYSAKDAARYEIIEKDDIKIGVFAIQYKDYKIAGKKMAGPLHDRREAVIKETISELKSKVDQVVLVYHGGDEFLFAPMPYFRKQMRNYLNMGCDLVVAHHPHVVQGYETFGKKMVFYSLGNFMFDTDYQRAQEGTDRGIILNISFTKDSYEFESLSIRIDRENKQVVSAEDDIHFADVKSTYKRLWATEAARKSIVLANAAELKARELELRSELEREKKEEIKALLEKYSIKTEELEDEEAAAEAEAEANSADEDDQDTNEDTQDTSEETQEESTSKKRRKKKRIRKFVKKTIKKIRKFFTRKTYEKYVIKYGAMKAKLFYK